jgi:hypothetical protein
MLAFKNYAINEYKIENIASVSFKFTHSLTTSLDKKTNELMNKHAINVAIKLFDKDLNLLHNDTLKFVNNVLNKKKADSLVNISPKELENRFNEARREIVAEIQKDYLEKRHDIDEKINSLMTYENITVKDHDIIKSAYKGELIQNANGENKQKFDM